MDKLHYLIAACNSHAWKRLTWRMSIFNVCRFPENVEPKAYDLNFIDGIPHFWNVDEDSLGNWEAIAGTKKDEELFWPEEEVAIKAGDYPGLDKDLITSAGRYVANWIVVYFSVGTRLPYLEDGTSFLVYENELYSRCLEYGTDKPEDTEALRPSHVAAFIQGLSELSPMCKAIAPTGTLRSLETHPDLYKVRDALLEKHKDELDDPAVVVKIQKILDDMDTEWLQGDQSIEFYKSKKSRMRRRKLLIMHGIEAAFKEGGDYTLIPTSLIEGGDLTKLVEKFNGVREGSFSRGAETAKGGEQVRIIQMIFQNHRITSDDCGTKLTHLVFINEANITRYVGMNMVETGKLVPLTKSMLAGMVGKAIRIRRPILCQRGHVDTCAGCSSVAKSKEERAIAADISGAMSNVMLNAMGAMHGRDTVVAEFKPRFHIT